MQHLREGVRPSLGSDGEGGLEAAESDCSCLLQMVELSWEFFLSIPGWVGESLQLLGKSGVGPGAHLMGRDQLYGGFLVNLAPTPSCSIWEVQTAHRGP